MEQVRDRIKEFRRVPAAEIVDNTGNFRKHPKAQQDALAGILKEVGIAGAVVAYYSARNGNKLTLIDGHLRKTSHSGAWPTLILDVTDAEADLLLATHDTITAMAETDQQALDSLLASCQVQDVRLQAMLDSLGTGQVDPAPEIPSEEPEPVEMKPPPQMVWVLIGVKLEDFAGIRKHITAIQESSVCSVQTNRDD